MKRPPCGVTIATTHIDFLVLGFGQLTCREVAHADGAHARGKNARSSAAQIIDATADGPNVRLSIQAMYLRVTAPQQQQHHHHHQTTKLASSSLFSVVSGLRGCQQQRTGGVHSKSQSSTAARSTPCTDVKTQRKSEIKHHSETWPGQRDTAGCVFSCV